MSDNLVFWRLYGQEGEGCSLSLVVPCKSLHRVLYGVTHVNETGQRLQSILELLRPIAQIDDQSKRETVQGVLADIVWKSLEHIRYLYKSEAYRYENECRVVVPELDVPKDKISLEYQGRYTYSRSIRSPQIRHYFEPRCLNVKKVLQTGSVITLGPCVSYPRNVAYCIEELKRRTQLAGPEIIQSKISYRNS